ncbi:MULTISPECIES: recombinase family protein [unclassified Neisseria]|uniref:recombinase family protein n=1 Tax=unclassified Neisseria TaxID=2623750 RepID=UPI001071A9FC|nr:MULTISPECIES: recombinase family protein [unclassified Neisseria]MBF0803303.1 recombinase family protein [Neisseria sp. 19428wB4_WF04]TFU43974.1 resolvase [Neisseria sp. WF04]
MDRQKIARIYLRVSTQQQNLDRQREIIEEAKKNGFYIAGVYEEKASGVNASRPELNKLIDDLQDGDWVIAEKIDRITRLPPREAELLIHRITEKGAKLHVPDVFSFGNIDDLMGQSDSLPKYLTEPLMDALQKMFLRMALSIAHEDWKTRRRRAQQGIERARKDGRMKGRPADKQLHKNIIQLTLQGVSITGIASALNCSTSTVSKVRRAHRAAHHSGSKEQFDIFKESTP